MPYSCSLLLYHNEELKSLTGYRFDKVHERTKLKSSVSGLVCILFPELEKLVSTLHMASIYALLHKFPGAKQIASVHLTQLTNLLLKASHGCYGREKESEIRNATGKSIDSCVPAKSPELKYMIWLMQVWDAEIEEIENETSSITDEVPFSY